MHSNLKLVLGVEDKPYFHWQLAILLESLRGQWPPGWEAWVVVCNDWGTTSEALRRIGAVYGARLLAGRHPGYSVDMDFADGGARYAPLNRIEALRVAASETRPGDRVYLAETDLFLYGPLDPTVFPGANALQQNWILSKPLFFAEGANERGVDLGLLLRSLGITRPFRPGGVSVFLDADTVRHAKFVKDCFRFAQILYLAGKITQVHKVWYAEMACFALALHANEIPYDVLDGPGFSTDVDRREIAAGSFYHYYHDPKDGGGFGAFPGDDWCKQDYYRRDFLIESSAEELAERADRTPTEHARAFFRLALEAKVRLQG